MVAAGERLRVAYNTHIGSLGAYEEGTIELKDDLRKYAFSNVFEVAGKAAPFERVAVVQNLEYVAEAVRVEGESGWYAAPHDEFAIVMDGQVEIELVKLDFPATVVPAGVEGSVRLAGPPVGRNMGFMRLKRGHQALLPPRAAYRFRATDGVGVILLQTILGPHSVQKWSAICRT